MFHSSVQASVSHLDSTCPGDVDMPSPAPCAILFPAKGNLGHLESRRENANTPASVGKIFLLTSPEIEAYRARAQFHFRGRSAWPSVAKNSRNGARYSADYSAPEQRPCSFLRVPLSPRNPAISFPFPTSPHFPRREQWSRARLSGASHSRCLRRGGWRGRRLEQTSGRKLKRRCDPDERGL